MTRGQRLRVSSEIVVGLAAIVFLAASIICPDWIEKMLGVSPDNGDGSIEWGVAFAAAAVSLVMSWLARRDWRAFMAAGRTDEVRNRG
jgi:hypothetical protein